MEKQLQIAPFGYFIFADNGLLLEGNDSFCQLLQYQPEELQGLQLDHFLTLPSKIFYQTHFFPLLKMQGHAEEIFLTLLRKDQRHLPVLVNAVKKTEGANHVYACAFIVVHNRKKFEDELVAARKKAEGMLLENSALQQLRDQLLEQSQVLDRQLQIVRQQNDELKQLTKVVSHELQEPVRKLAVFSGMLTGTSAEETNKTDILSRLDRSVEQLIMVVAGLQRFLWLQDTPLAYKEVDLAAIIMNAAQQLAAELNQDLIDINIEQIPVFRADPDQMHILAYQLLSNAIKFRKPHEKAKLTVKAVTFRKNIYKELVDRYAYEEHIKIDFIDQGTGFDPTFSQKVLQLFYRLEKSHGPGIGLALCKRVVDNHKGSIEIHTNINKGLTATIILPLFDN
jgi:sigma-B regulation protein RsbU (phosphoserine phosphatase)